MESELGVPVCLARCQRAHGPAGEEIEAFGEFDAAFADGGAGHLVAGGDRAHRIARVGKPAHDREAFDGEGSVGQREDFPDQAAEDVPELFVGEPARVDGRRGLAVVDRIARGGRGVGEVIVQAAAGSRAFLDEWLVEALGGQGFSFARSESSKPVLVVAGVGGVAGGLFVGVGG